MYVFQNNDINDYIELCFTKNQDIDKQNNQWYYTKLNDKMVNTKIKFLYFLN